jgi:uncharacterized SAM-binding protein YcdF (DUF218 family)
MNAAAHTFGESVGRAVLSVRIPLIILIVAVVFIVGRFLYRRRR